VSDEPSGRLAGHRGRRDIFHQDLRLLVLIAGAVVFGFLVVLPLTWPQQAVCGLLTLIMTLVLARSSDSYLITLVLMITSVFCTCRYGYGECRRRGISSGSVEPLGALDAFFILCLLVAEVYAFAILFLGTFRRYGRCGARRWHCRMQPKNGRMWM